MNILVNPEENRLRAGWRLGAQFFLMFLIGFGLIWLISRFHTVTGNLLTTGAIAIGAVVSMLLAARGLDLRPWRQYGLLLSRNELWHGVLGFIIAGGVIGVIFIIEYAAGWIHVTGFGWQQFSNTPYLWSFSTYLLWMIIVGFYEEMVFRGYQIVNLSEGLNMPALNRRQAVWMAVGLSSLIFGVMHATNPNAGWISTLNIAFAGLMLALPFVITGRLSLSIGLHIGWNFFQGGVFGFPVSGVAGQASVLQIKQQGPELLTGGTFGPEAGLLGLAGMLLIVTAILLYFSMTNQSWSLHDQLGIYTLSKSHTYT